MTGKMYSWYLFYFQFMNSLPYTFLWVSWKCFHTVFLLSKMHLQNLLLCFFHSFVTCSSSVGFHRFKNITLHLFILLKCVLWLTNSERDGNTRAPDLPLEKPICKSGSNSYNWTWNNSLAPNREKSTSRLYIVTLLIQLLCRVHHEKCWAGRSTSWNQDCQEKYK